MVNNVMGDIVNSLQDMGVYEFFLPFLLVFAIVFAILENIQIFRGKKNINTIVALVFGLIVVVQTEIVELINAYLSKMALFIIVILVFLLAVGVFGGKGKTTGTTFGILFFISLIAVVWALSPSIGLGWPHWLSPSRHDVPIIIVIAGSFLLIVWAVRGKPSSGGTGGSSGTNFWSGMSGFFDKIGKDFRDVEEGDKNK